MRRKNYRTIIKSRRYERELKSIFRGIQRADEAMEGLEWILCRFAEDGMAVRGTKFDSWPLHLEDVSYVVAYVYDDDVVECVSIIEAVPPS